MQVRLPTEKIEGVIKKADYSNSPDILASDLRDKVNRDMVGGCVPKGEGE